MLLKTPKLISAHLMGGSSRLEPAWTSCSSLVLAGSASAVSRLAGWERRGVRRLGRGRAGPLGATAGTCGSTLVLRYTPLRPINIITALKPLQFVSDLRRCNRRPLWARRAPPLTRSPLPGPRLLLDAHAPRVLSLGTESGGIWDTRCLLQVY